MTWIEQVLRLTAAVLSTAIVITYVIMASVATAASRSMASGTTGPSRSPILATLADRTTHHRVRIDLAQCQYVCDAHGAAMGIARRLESADYP